ncbi:MAG: N-acetylmuramoyl-L-alanine amidase [Alphaproteobacteria bacterium]|nr:N-acetylmuramoyl-L-alanine amidase [Alphaproteobacteria bacterium]HCP01214.1 N-acetylmuramoyl-L-alanine amidase [Rhodospirillaceae bacterium]
MSLILKRLSQFTDFGPRLFWVLVFAFVVITTPVQSFAGNLKVQDIRVGVHASATRFVVELNDNVEPRIFGLPDPFRVVIDLPEVDFDLEEERIGDGAGQILKLRYGLFRPGTSRFVLDLKSPSKVTKKFVLKPSGGKPWRLVIDLEPTSRADFVVSMRPNAGDNPSPVTRVPVPSAPRQKIKPVVVVDAGHGGVDPGAIGVSGVYEKKIALDYAREVVRLLRVADKYEVIMTRDRDVFLPLRERVRVSRAAGADLFLSLHANTHPKRSTSGFSVYTLSDRASDKEAAALAALENKSDVIGGVNLGGYSDDVQNILIDFAQAKTNELSVEFARDILVEKVKNSASLLTRPWRSAGFAVLKAPDVPSVLVELGYISNPQEERLLLTGSHRRKLCAAIVNAVDAYFKTKQSAAL